MNAAAMIHFAQDKETRSFFVPSPIPDSVVGSWQFKQALNLTVASTLVGLLYVVFGDGFDSAVPFINGGLIGFLGGLGVTFGELILFKSIKKRISFIGIVTMKSTFYTLMMAFLIFTEVLVSRSLQFEMTIRETLHSDTFRRFIYDEDFIIIIFYAMLFISLLIFTREMSRKMGQGVLFNFITGRYFKPKLERRIFMFLDLNSSALKAEMLGDLKYHNLLNDFFRDITPSILRAKGQIHHYVGDEVVVSWPLNKKTKTEICLQAFFYSAKKIKSVKERYLSRYGLIPQFKAAFHCGDVIYGEIGEIKSEIVFHGDVMNTTSRLERMCSELNENILVSKTLFATFPLDVQDLFRSTANIRLRGKQRPMEVFGLRPGITEG